MLMVMYMTVIGKMTSNKEMADSNSLMAPHMKANSCRVSPMAKAFINSNQSSMMTLNSIVAHG